MSILSNAVLNNVDWCDLICGLHGTRGVYKTDAWLNTEEVPKYYPNLVTLSREIDQSRIKEWLSVEGASFAIKDSFNSLDLGSLGFTKILEAHWLLAPEIIYANKQVTTVGDEATLDKWIKAWDSEQSSTFSAALLQRDDVRFLSLVENNQIVAGAILYKSRGVVGLSNAFCNAEDDVEYWKSMVTAANRYFPGLQIVGYEGGSELDTALEAGFKSLGPLAVWIKT